MHTSHSYEAELAALRERVVSMGRHCEQSVQLALEAFWQSSLAISARVRAQDEVVDADEVAIDEAALRILALRQPVADDLRFLTGALKLVTDLERIGDEAVDISERASVHHGTATELVRGELERMATTASNMLGEVLSALAERDAARAERVLGEDAQVDEAYSKVMGKISAHMAKHPEAVPEGLGLVKVARYLERIADHTTNIAEDVIFMVRGEDVRHTHARVPDVG